MTLLLLLQEAKHSAFALSASDCVDGLLSLVVSASVLLCGHPILPDIVLFDLLRSFIYERAGRLPDLRRSHRRILTWSDFDVARSIVERIVVDRSLVEIEEAATCFGMIFRQDVWRAKRELEGAGLVVRECIVSSRRVRGTVREHARDRHDLCNHAAQPRSATTQRRSMDWATRSQQSKRAALQHRYLTGSGNSVAGLGDWASARRCEPA